MEYITTREASAKWGITTTRITILANEGRIPGARQVGRNWLIPANATKPPERKAGHSRSVGKEAEAADFSFPLYHFRPDRNMDQEAQLTGQQRSLLLAETAVLECRFEEAWPVLEAVLHAPDDSYTEIAALWNLGMCCIALNKPDDFDRIFLRLQLLLSEDHPHRDDLMVILDELKTYVETIDSSAKNTSFPTNIHYQAIPMTCVLKGYVLLVREAAKPGTADASLLELNLRFLETTGAVLAVEMVHCYLLGIYSLRRNMAEAQRHAEAMVRIAYKNKLYFPLVSYYRYNTAIFSPILDQYPEDFRNLCLDLSLQYERNYSSFVASISENSVLAKITEEEYPYAFAALMGLSNSSMAKKLGVHPQTVNNKITKLCKKLGAKDKKALRLYLQSYM